MGYSNRTIMVDTAPARMKRVVDWRVMECVVHWMSLTVSLTAVWAAGKLGLTAFWPIAVISMLLVAATANTKNFAGRTENVLGGLLSTVIRVFDCHSKAALTKEPKPAFLIKSSARNKFDVLPSWVRYSIEL